MQHHADHGVVCAQPAKLVAKIRSLSTSRHMLLFKVGRQRWHLISLFTHTVSAHVAQLAALETLR